MVDEAVKKFKVRDEVKYYPKYWAGKKLAYPHVHPYRLNLLDQL